MYFCDSEMYFCDCDCHICDFLIVMTDVVGKEKERKWENKMKMKKEAGKKKLRLDIGMAMGARSPFPREEFIH